MSIPSVPVPLASICNKIALVSGFDFVGVRFATNNTFFLIFVLYFAVFLAINEVNNKFCITNSSYCINSHCRSNFIVYYH